MPTALWVVIVVVLATALAVTLMRHEQQLRELRQEPPMFIRDYLDEAIVCLLRGTEGDPPPHTGPPWHFGWAIGLSNQLGTIVDPELRSMARELAWAFDSNNHDGLPKTTGDWKQLLIKANNARLRFGHLEMRRR